MSKVLHTNEGCYLPGVFDGSLTKDKHFADRELFFKIVNKFSDNNGILNARAHDIVSDIFNVVPCLLCLHIAGFIMENNNYCDLFHFYTKIKNSVYGDGTDSICDLKHTQTDARFGSLSWNNFLQYANEYICGGMLSFSCKPCIECLRKGSERINNETTKG